MGELADMHLDGTLCNMCGSLMEDLLPNEGDVLLPSPGFPRLCEDCEEVSNG